MIRSHPVALQQCDRFLSALGHCNSESYWDTAAAARAVVTHDDPHAAAIAPADCAELFGLDILATEISDHQGNETRFVLIGREPEDVDGDRLARTSLFFSVLHEQGSLSSCLQTFAKHGSQPEQDRKPASARCALGVSLLRRSRRERERSACLSSPRRCSIPCS